MSFIDVERRHIYNSLQLYCLNILSINNSFKYFTYRKTLILIIYIQVHVDCFGFSVPLENFSLMWRRHHYRWRAATFDVYSTLMAIKQWGFFNVPLLLWHLFIIVITFTSALERLEMELSLPVLTTWVFRGQDSNTQLSAYEAYAIADCATAGATCR